MFWYLNKLMDCQYKRLAAAEIDELGTARTKEYQIQTKIANWSLYIANKHLIMPNESWVVRNLYGVQQREVQGPAPREE